MTAEQTIRKRYIREIRHIMPIYRKTERKFLTDLESAIEDYTESTGNSSREAIEKEYGEPKDVVAGYITILDSDELRGKINLTHHVKIASYVIIACVAFACGIFSFVLSKERFSTQNAQISHETIIISGNNDDIDIP